MEFLYDEKRKEEEQDYDKKRQKMQRIDNIVYAFLNI